MLKERGIDFLLDVKDSMSEYLQVGSTRFKEYVEESKEENRRMLMQLPRPQAIELAHSLRSFKKSLADFLEEESKKGVGITITALSNNCALSFLGHNRGSRNEVL